MMESIRKWLNKPKADDKSLLARFYHADRGLTAVANELDSFDGRSEPERCSRLVSKLRQEQDRVLGIINQIMDELLDEDRACRAFRAKFPEEVLQESLSGQLWFGAECLSAGSAILNREVESAEMRPLAKAVTKSLDNVRNLLRDQCLRNNTPNSPILKLDLHNQATETLYESLKIFDRLFAEFELLYVSAMVQVKSKQEHEIQELICVLFSETLQRALKLQLLDQEQVDTYDPSLMFSIPRLAIVSGLIIFNEGPLNMDQSSDKLSEMFRPFRKLLVKMRDYLRTLNKNELYQLEKLLCTNEPIILTQSKPDDSTVECHETTIDVSTTTNVTIVPSSDNALTTSKSNDNFFSKESYANANEWVAEEAEIAESEAEDVSDSNQDNLMSADCATGFLVPNTNLGNLLQSSAAPLTFNIISNNNQDEAGGASSEATTNSRDSGMGTGDSGSLDRTPDQEGTNVLSVNQYDESWKNLKKLVEPSTSRSAMASHYRSKEKSAKRRSRKHQSSSSEDNSSSSSGSSSSATSPSSSASGESKEVSRRMKFNSRSTENLLHRLFVCIAGVADQLQTNFAADLRQILRSVFQMNCTQDEPEDQPILEETKSKDSQQDLFEFRASEENVIRQSNSSHGSIGSQQSICSAEEANPESDTVFAEETQEGEESTEVDDDNALDRSRKRRYGNRLTGRSISLSDDGSSSSNTHREDDLTPTRNYSISSSPSASHLQAPPRWLPDEEVHKCMDCDSQFTAFRRRHHCRNCGNIFCGTCSSSNTPLPKFGLTKPVRVCKGCYNREATATTA